MSTLTEAERQARLELVQRLQVTLHPETKRPYTVPQIAQAVGVSRQAMWQFMRRHHMVLGKRNPLTPNFVKQEAEKTARRRAERAAERERATHGA